MSIYEQLALLYVEKNAQQGDAPEKLLSLYRDAYDKITKCDKANGGKHFLLNNSLLSFAIANEFWLNSLLAGHVSFDSSASSSNC